MELSLDTRIGNHGSFLQFKQPMWEEVEKAIRALNQSLHTEVTLAKDDESYMAIAGGNGD